MFKKLGNRVGNITVLLNHIVKYMKIVHFMSKMWKKNLLSYKNKNASHEAALERCLWQGLDRNAALSGPHGNWGWWEAVDDIRIATFSVPHHGPYVFLQLSLATAYFIVFFSKLFPLHFCQFASWLQLHP